MDSNLVPRCLQGWFRTFLIVSTTYADLARPPRNQRWRLATEIATIAVFYVAYSAVRNSFGSAEVDPADALRNAQHIIDIERSVGLFFEGPLQDLVIGAEWFVWLLNVFYGTFHFAVTIGALAWAFFRLPDQYRRWRNTLAATTGLAIIGFSLFPVMPPRLLADCGVYGGCSGSGMVDTVAEFGGLWSFDSGAMESVSNQYAAVPSLHMAWALWCALLLVPRISNRPGRALMIGYPIVTFVTILITANHYWLDAVLGLATLGAGALIAHGIEVFVTARRHGPDRPDHRAGVIHPGNTASQATL